MKQKDDIILNEISRRLKKKFLSFRRGSMPFLTWDSLCIEFNSQEYLGQGTISWIEQNYGSYKNLNYEVFWKLVEEDDSS